NKGVYIPAMVWKDMYDFSPDCIMLALASEHYDPDEYIRDYDLYVRRVREDGDRRIRPLLLKDAPFMLEWMEDPSINKFFKFSIGDVNIDKAEHFIKRAMRDSEDDDEPSSLHYAVVDGKDEYYGTVSLKHINWQDKSAEYAISTRKCAKHRGYGQFATREIIKKAFEVLHLERVFLYVLPDNDAAITMYKKCGFIEEPSRDSIEKVRGRDIRRMCFEIKRDDYYLNRR
ncbi:MAG: GNAT family N-acetyltransferase, partial [Lachnospiraceae bacterium]|nr:GNAT family N-acetyltransferase [Lachnospiraceae bacterium]